MCTQSLNYPVVTLSCILSYFSTKTACKGSQAWALGTAESAMLASSFAAASAEDSATAYSYYVKASHAGIYTIMHEIIIFIIPQMYISQSDQSI